LIEVEHFVPGELGEVPNSGFDLYINVDDGLRYDWPKHLKPSVCWIIDTHIDFDWSLKKARNFDFVFAAQRDGAAALRHAGIASAKWLPLACDPELHRPHDVEHAFDVAFVGNVFPGPRLELIESIRRKFDRTFVGNAYRDEMARVYSASRIVFNRSVVNDVNMRVFEAIACGSLLVTNDLAENGQSELFESGTHVVTYHDSDELIDRIRYFLTHSEERQRIARAGRARVLSEHTYLHRMVDLLRSVERGLQRRTLALSSIDPSPEQLPPHASVCLISWKRPDNVRTIVEHLRVHPRIDDIVVWNNNPDAPLVIEGDDVTVINSSKNVVTYGRFLATKHARHDIIYTQDDDCIVGNIDHLFETFDLDSSSIAHGLKLGHLMQNSGNLFGCGHVALLGWGSVFDRRWCSAIDKYIEVYGEDELLRRKADRIFTLLLERRHRSIPAVVTDLPGASGPESLSVRSDHESLTAEAISRVMTIQNQSTIPAHSGDSQSTPTEFRGGKDTSYFDFARPELLSLIPDTATKVLDVGCGAGRLGEALRSRQTVEVWGIEREPDVAEIARQRLDHVITADADSELSELKDARFDVIVCGDVLEHLRHPRAFLTRCRAWLSATGRIVASIPNVRHHTIIAGLLDGNWTYEAAGLLDDDHVRFFTRREIEKLLFRAGFEIERIGFVPGEGYAEWQQAGSPGEIDVGSFTLNGMSREEAEEFHAYQYLVCAIPRRRVSNQELALSSSSLRFHGPSGDRRFRFRAKKRAGLLTDRVKCWPPNSVIQRLSCLSSERGSGCRRGSSPIMHRAPAS